MNETSRYRWRAGLLTVCVMSLLLGGCAVYEMQGVVLEGTVSTIRIVDADDPRLLEGYSLPLATVETTMDAERLSRQPLPRDVSDADGTFAVPVDEPGAGYLDYYVRMVVRKVGYDTAVEDFRVPGPNQRVLVTLARGQDTYVPEAKDVLEETLERGEPYLR